MLKVFENRRTEAVYIAEIGLNHNGSFDSALEMIDAASRGGAHGVKFQSFNPELMNSPYTASLLEKGYEEEYSTSTEDFFKELILTQKEMKILKKHAESLGLIFFSAPFDIESLNMLLDLDVSIIKIASSEVTNIPLLEATSLSKKDIILSTGMASMQEIKRACDILKKGGGDVILLHCVSLYPTNFSEANLNRIPLLRDENDCEVGLSDHSKDLRIAQAAAVLGCRIFEKHFTLVGDYDCPDRDVSLDEVAFAEMIDGVEKTIAMLGTGKSQNNEKEMAVARAARRSLFYSRDLVQGDVLKEDDIVLMRPGIGLEPEKIKDCLGKRLLTNALRGKMIRLEDLDMKI
jgi:N,N'-diacetyllegionaminate synthase